jgi:Domain of unknown function DUF29
VTAAFPSFEDDFYGWLLDQAAALKGQRYSRLDWNNLSEELQATARTLEQGLENDLEVLLTHLLQWHYQPRRRNANWQAAIQNARSSIADRLDDSPRLAAKLKKLTTRAYRKARRSAGAAMGLSERQWESKFPPSCEWDVGSLKRPDFWPEHDERRQSAG